ncbi:hypothetical protein Tco_0318650 [Tanacetum coccineum]
MISEEMKHTEHYRMYAKVFEIVVTLTQSQPTESTQGMHKTSSALEPRSDKESPEVEITNDEEVEITNSVIPVNVNEEEEEITEEVMVESLPTMVDTYIKEQVKTQVPKQVKVQVPMYVVKGLLLERQQNKEETDKMIAKAMLQERGKLQAKISSHIQKAINTNIPSLVDASVRSYMSGHILHVHPAQPQTTSIPKEQYQLYLSMKADPHAKQQKTSEYEAHLTGESSRQVNEKEQGQSSSRNQEQTDDYDFWTESYASDDD